MAFDFRVIGDSIATDAFDEQKAQGDAYVTEHAPAPIPPPDPDAVAFALLMTKVMGTAIARHVVGYWGTVVTAPDVAAPGGLNLPIPCTVMQVDSGGVFVGVWWKTGPGALDWESQTSSGGTTILDSPDGSIKFDPDGEIDGGGGVTLPIAESDVVDLVTDLAGKLSARDPSVTNARAPTAHAATHASAGSDPITVAESQVTNLTTDLAAKEPALGNPSVTGYVLSSTTGGARSWVAQSAGGGSPALIAYLAMMG